MHTYGLLRNSFQPPDEIRIMRTMWRHRAGLVAEAASCIQRIQKSMAEMNLQLGNAIGDLSGMTGMAILHAILNGERDPSKLAARAQPGIKAPQTKIAESLRGTWREELLFVMRQELDWYETCKKKIAECDEKLKLHLPICPRQRASTPLL